MVRQRRYVNTKVVGSNPGPCYLYASLNKIPSCNCCFNIKELLIRTRVGWLK